MTGTHLLELVQRSVQLPCAAFNLDLVVEGFGLEDASLLLLLRFRSRRHDGVSRRLLRWVVDAEESAVRRFDGL